MKKRAVLLAAVVVAVIGLAACSRSATPDPAQAPFVLGTMDGEVRSYDRLVGAWHGTEFGESFVEVSIREGWSIHLRGRCTGSGVLKMRMTAISMSFTDGWTCDGQWRFLMMFFPANELAVGRIDLGPFTVALDRADTITSWDVEAYSTEPTPSLGPSLSPWPSPSLPRA
ncbi:hypothetical protein AB0K00_29870 [Dactylosporangium sp. NPDC049525]|uniref:hypothetical protein n=1 Tax=Dactylosporangium sp. NPDC049525 TaxID=3154730 RepID=UPI003444C05B